jgi:hypothetical protein
MKKNEKKPHFAIWKKNKILYQIFLVAPLALHVTNDF